MNRLLVAVAALASAGCITYDFEPVTPIAVTQTTRVRQVTANGALPNVMLLLDKSGSMKDPIDPTCTGAACRTRIDDLRAAMGPFLSQYGAVARFGLATFPQGGSDQCAAPQGVRLDIAASNDVPTELTAWAGQIDGLVQQLGGAEPVGGGTPTAASLGMLGALPSLHDAQREDIVVLLTDGLPNCNAQNPVTCGPAGTCKCTQGAQNPTCAGVCPTGCLDDLSSVQAVRDLAAAQIRTAVIGFGGDTNGSTVLDEMAAEGGLPHACTQNSDCGAGGPCQSGICKTKFYQANNGAELAAALKAVVGTPQSPCDYPMGFVPEPGAIFAVIVDGKSVSQDPVDAWYFDSSVSTLKLVGALCNRAKASGVFNPMNVEIRVLEQVQ